MVSKNPATPAEWQEAVNAAFVMRRIADCVMYGLITTDLVIDIDRCDEILERGAAHGYRPKPGIIGEVFA